MTSDLRNKQHTTQKKMTLLYNKSFHMKKKKKESYIKEKKKLYNKTLKDVVNHQKSIHNPYYMSMVNLCTVFTLFWESCLTYIWSKKFIKKRSVHIR